MNSRIRLPVLVYHHVGQPHWGGYPYLTIPPEKFERQIRRLAEKGYSCISASDWIAMRQGKKPVSEKPLLLTFDDAYSDLIPHAFPILRNYGFAATVFVVTAYIGATNEWDKKNGYATDYPLMDESQIREWAGNGIEYGAHSRTHVDLRNLTANEVQQEVEGSRRELESILNAPVLSFAYPYGFYNSMVRDCVREYFALAFTTERGINRITTDPYRMRRTMILPSDSRAGLACRLRIGWNPSERLRNLLSRNRE